MNILYNLIMRKTDISIRWFKYFLIKLQGKNLEYLYHFTDSRNIQNINSIGLFSFSYLKDDLNLKEYDNFFPSSSQLSRRLDNSKGLSDYIRLTPNKFHPMITALKYREEKIEELSWLQFTFKDIFTSCEDILFSNTNAAATKAIINSNPNTFLNSKDIQREILVKRHIPRDKIVILD